MSSIVVAILQRVGKPDLVKILSEELSGTELNSVLLEVFNKRSCALTPARLLSHYQKNRFVKPADVPVLEMKRMEIDMLSLFEQFHFQSIELSPVAAFGSCSVVATADQSKILSALRGTEVLADATNSIALHYSDLKQRREIADRSNDKIRFSTIQRHLRTPVVHAKGFTPHFKIGCLVTCGMDTGSYQFEKESLEEHIRAMTMLYRGYFKVEDLRFRFLCRGGYAHTADRVRQVKDFILHRNPGTVIDIVENPEKQIDYYKGIQYKIDIRVHGKTYEIGDGGFVDWTQQLLQNKKERMLSTGIGFEFMYRILRGDV